MPHKTLRNFTFVLMALLALGSCSQGQNQSGSTSLSASGFDTKINETPGALILDVRSPEEFAGGHLENAVNLDWNSDGFEKGIPGLNKDKPVFIYCLSGGRSAAAARFMRKNGFKTVYELEGGLMKWKAANLPLTTSTAPGKPGISVAQWDSLLHSEKWVLIDFYAEWCGPCKKMKPFLDEIALEMKDSIEIIRINADDNPELCSTLKIDALPTLNLYRNKELIWNHVGFISKEALLDKLRKG